jgi:hypothetical protein
MLRSSSRRRREGPSRCSDCLLEDDVSGTDMMGSSRLDGKDKDWPQ